MEGVSAWPSLLEAISMFTLSTCSVSGALWAVKVFFFIFKIMCMGPVHHEHAWCPWRLEHWIPGTGIISGCKSAWTPDPLSEQPVFF